MAIIGRNFTKKSVSNVFSPREKDCVTSLNNFYFLCRYDRGDRHEFRLETEYLTLGRFYIPKGLKSKSQLIEVLKDLDRFEGEK